MLSIVVDICQDMPSSVSGADLMWNAEQLKYKLSHSDCMYEGNCIIRNIQELTDNLYSVEDTYTKEMVNNGAYFENASVTGEVPMRYTAGAGFIEEIDGYRMDKQEEDEDSDRVTERGKEILRGELEAAGYSSIEAQMIIYMIEKENPSYLSTLYALDSYGDSSSKDAVVVQIISYYELNKNPEDNLLDVVLENYRNDENISDYDVYVGYLDYLKDEYYICQAEYEEILGNLKEGEPIPEEEIRKMEKLLEERNNLIETLKNDEISNGVNVPGWKKVEIVTALQIEIKLLEAGYEEEFVYGIIGNIKAEGGKFGGLEGINETGYPYWEHIDDCINYREKYDPYDMTEVNLIELYFDRTTCSSDIHYWGIGVVQWTYDHRTMPLLEKYLDIAGYRVTENGIETKEPPHIVITAENSDSVCVYLTYDQLCEAETQHILDELQSEDYKDVEEVYLNNKVHDDFDYNIREAAELIQYEYIENRDPSFTPVRQENAVRWCEARN